MNKSELREFLKKNGTSIDRKLLSLDEGISGVEDAINRLSERLGALEENISAIPQTFENFGNQVQNYINSQISHLQGIYDKDNKSIQSELNELSQAIFDANKSISEAHGGLAQLADSINSVASWSHKELEGKLPKNAIRDFSSENSLNLRKLREKNELLEKKLSELREESSEGNKQIRSRIKALSEIAENASMISLQRSKVPVLASGSGITITQAGDTYTITATSGTGINPQTPLGTINSSNRVFTCTGLVKVAYADGTLDTGATITGAVNSTITYSVPPQNNVYAF